MKWTSITDCETRADSIDCDDDMRDKIITEMYNGQECLDCAIEELGLTDEFSTDGHCGECSCCSDEE